jgi:hypothetical protein
MILSQQGKQRGLKGSKEQPIFSLHRYYTWANRMRLHFDEKLAVLAGQAKNGAATFTSEDIEANLYMSYWYAGLYVVIEGWSQLRLSDPIIDGLLKSPKVGLLKRYRHGVFHFQTDYFDNRFTDFMEEGQSAVDWVRDLNRAFGAFFLKWYGARK